MLQHLISKLGIVDLAQGRLAVHDIRMIDAALTRLDAMPESPLCIMCARAVAA